MAMPAAVMKSTIVYPNGRWCMGRGSAHPMVTAQTSGSATVPNRETEVPMVRPDAGKPLRLLLSRGCRSTGQVAKSRASER
jgi:hypothetical protein